MYQYYRLSLFTPPQKEKNNQSSFIEYEVFMLLYIQDMNPSRAKYPLNYDNTYFVIKVMLAHSPLGEMG